MLAYLFWHQPQPGVDRDAYEDAQRAFHARLEASSASFRLDALPFREAEGYEDWYLVDDWRGLGELNAAAVDAGRRADHDLAASMSGRGWGGVYQLLRGPVSPPQEASWIEKPRGESLERFLSAIEAEAIWQRQMVLGPAPEFCIGAGGGKRTPIWPAS